jgi:hypothetical protein
LNIWFLKASVEINFYDLSSDISFSKNASNSFPAVVSHSVPWSIPAGVRTAGVFLW